MVQTPKKKCEHSKCRGAPNFNSAGQKEGRFCNKHKLEGMKKVVVGGAPKKGNNKTKAQQPTRDEIARPGKRAATEEEVRRAATEAAKERAAVRAAALSAAMNSKGSPRAKDDGVSSGEVVGPASPPGQDADAADSAGGSPPHDDDEDDASKLRKWAQVVQLVGGGISSLSPAQLHNIFCVTLIMAQMWLIPQRHRRGS
mmetsp:Transcript_13778/g.21792  ORF Transcript_13778/g.21792 Transcript_13778/m.21792 type:complete len:199 (-) Transcript_13778:272-868(-)